MATLLTNRAYPERRADYSLSDTLVVGFAAHDGQNQRWISVPIPDIPGIFSIRTVNPNHQVGVQPVADPNPQVYGGGPEWRFALEPVAPAGLDDNGVRIRITLGGENLYWTLVNGLQSTSVRVFPRREGAPGTENDANTQIWDRAPG